MTSTPIKRKGNLYELSLFEESYSTAARSMGGSTVPEETIKYLAQYMEFKHSQNSIGCSPPTYLWNGVLTKVTRHGHKRFKNIKFLSETTQAIIDLVSASEIKGLELTLSDHNPSK